jgi:hypothetical protein
MSILLVEYVTVLLNRFPTVIFFLQQISIEIEIAKEDICATNWGTLST